MQAVLLGLSGVVLFLAGVFAVYKANGRPRFRYRQLLLPVVALAYGLLAVRRYVEIDASVWVLVEWLERKVPPLASLINIPFLEAMICNFLILVGFVAIKGLYKGIVALAANAYETGLNRLFGVVYHYDEDYGFWFLRQEYQGARRLFRNLYVCAVAIAALLFMAMAIWPDFAGFDNQFYPAFAVLVLGECCFFLFGLTRGEYLDGVDFEDDGAVRVFQYAKVQEALRHYFGDRLLQSGSRGSRRRTSSTHADFCDELAQSDDHSARIAGEYFKSLVSRGILGDGGHRASYGALNHDLALECVRLLRGESIVFATPFYRDVVPYVFLPLSAQLLRNKRVLVLYGSGASEDELRAYVEEGLSFATSVPDMWSVGTSMDLDADEPCDIVLVPFSSLGDVRNAIDHAPFLEQVSFVVVVDPSSLLATYQIGLNYLAEYLSQGTSATYCVFDRNSDGLVDSLSHALRVNLTEVSATEYAEGSAIYMMWDVDGENLQHRLMPGVAQYLGVGTEIGLVALKSQVSTVSWASNTAVPLADQRWIDGQYYGDLLAFSKIPQEQLQLDKRFEWCSDMWSMRKAQARFVVAEDEYANMYEAFRQFGTRGAEQVFVNVLSPHYVLRPYMVDNFEMFEADPKAVPSLSPDFAKSQRNAIFSIVMAIAQSDELLAEDEIAARLRYVGLPFHNVREAVEGLLIDHIDVSDDFKGVLPEDQLIVREVEEYDPAQRAFVTKRYYGLSNHALYTESFSSLRSVPLITERPDGSKQLLGARLYGHVYQSFLPGQFTVIGGKYYEVVTVSDSSVVLRRAADHFSHRRYYRQLRSYTIQNWEPVEGASSTRTIADIVVQRVLVTMEVATEGYLDLANFGDLGNAQRVLVSDIPSRRYTNKSALRLEFPGASPEAVTTLAVLMSEFLVTLFPRDWNYIAVLALYGNELPEGMLSRFACDCADNVIYIVEDSLIDTGLVSCVDRNVQRIMELCWDYLDWHRDKMDGVVDEEPEWEVGSLPEFVAPPVYEGFFRRLLGRLKRFFGIGSSKKASPAALVPEEPMQPVSEAAPEEPAQPVSQAGDSDGIGQIVDEGADTMVEDGEGADAG